MVHQIDLDLRECAVHISLLNYVTHVQIIVQPSLKAYKEPLYSEKISKIWYPAVQIHHYVTLIS